MNRMQLRLNALNTLERALATVTDEEINALVAKLPEEHLELLTKVAGTTPEEIRTGIVAGKMDTTMENIAALLTDSCLNDCIESLGDHAEDPTEPQLAEVVPGLVERHGKAVTQVMFACTMAGEAKAANNIRAVLKSNEHVAMPANEMRDFTAGAVHKSTDDPDRAAVVAARKARKDAEKATAAAAKAKALALTNKAKK